MSLVGILKKLYSNEIVEDWKKYKQNPKKNPTREEHSIKKRWHTLTSDDSYT
jgi:hypothetical protein